MKCNLCNRESPEKFTEIRPRFRAKIPLSKAVEYRAGDFPAALGEDFRIFAENIPGMLVFVAFSSKKC
jgi:hypothetical protein